MHRTSLAVGSLLQAEPAADTVTGDHRAYGYVFGWSGGVYKMHDPAWRITTPSAAFPPLRPCHPEGHADHADRTEPPHSCPREKVSCVAQALEPGWSGDIFEGLNVEQRFGADQAHAIRCQ